MALDVVQKRKTMNKNFEIFEYLFKNNLFTDKSYSFEEDPLAISIDFKFHKNEDITRGYDNFNTELEIYYKPYSNLFQNKFKVDLVYNESNCITIEFRIIKSSDLKEIFSFFNLKFDPDKFNFFYKEIEKNKETILELEKFNKIAENIIDNFNLVFS